MKATNTAVLNEGILAISGLSRALGGDARLSDVGSLLWVLLRPVVPCDTVALFVPDDSGGQVVVRYAAGTHAMAFRSFARPMSAGVAGWVAANRRPILNAEPVLDLGPAASVTPALRSSLVVPMVDGQNLAAVLALYSTGLLAFTEEHLDMLDALGRRLARMLGHGPADDGALGAPLRLVKRLAASS